MAPSTARILNGTSATTRSSTTPAAPRRSPARPARSTFTREISSRSTPACGRPRRSSPTNSAITFRCGPSSMSTTTTRSSTKSSGRVRRAEPAAEKVAGPGSRSDPSTKGAARWSCLNRRTLQVAGFRGRQEESGCNGHFESACYPPLPLFDQHGDCLAAKPRPGNVHSAGDWDELLLPEIERRQSESWTGEHRRTDRENSAHNTP